MADWRDRGFVPDSDEEDEEAIIETQVNREGNLNLDDDEFRDIDDVLQGDKATEIENQHPTHDGQVLEWKDNPKSTERSPTPGTNSTAGPLTRGFRPSSTEGAEGQNQNGVNISPHTHDSTCRPKTPDTVRENGIDYYDGTTTAELGAEQSHKGKAGGNSILDVWEEPEHTFLSSSLSSPLSELPSSPITELIRRNDSPSPSSRKTSAMEQGSGMQPRVHSPRARDHDMSQVQQAFAEEIAMSGRPARALRQRNPIQLHPYMLESERYRQFLKARGVKPLRIAQAQAEAESSGVNSEEQDLDADESQSQGHRNLLYADSSPPILIAENRETATNPLPEGSGSPDPQADAEELPDVDFLLRGPLSHGIREGYKRRKTSHTYGRHVETTLRKPTNAVPRGSTIGNICDTVMVVPDNVFDIPPSPPLSGNLSVHEHGPLVTSEFRFPHGRSSIHPVTPLTSSASKQRSVINLPEDSDTESLSSASSSSTTSSLASGPTQSHQLHQVQRKIRGVLPASWLRLDLKTQKKRPETIFERNQRSVSPNRCQLHRGVARKMPVSRKHVPTADHDDINPVFISDESDVYSEEHITDLKHAGERPLPRSEFDGDTLIRPPLGDIEEDNRIDAMLPSKPRQRRVGHPQKRRQTRLTDRGPTTVKRDATHHTHFKHQHFEPCHQPRITEHLSRAKSSTAKLRPAVPRLSVLDAPELRTDLKNATPNFIRVAARQARSRNDGGRHAPTQKFIRLGNRADTADVQSVLRDWREGAITAKPQSPKTSHNRAALKELSGNEQRTANPQASHKQVEPNPPLDINFTLSHTHDIFKPSAGRQAVRKQIIRQRQWAHPVVSRLDRTNVPSHGKVHNAAGPRRLLSSLQNTAGPRLAQLETIESRNRSSNQRAGFEDILSRIDRVSRPSAHYGPTPPSFPLARFLESEDSLPSSLSLPYAQQAFEPGKPHGPNGREPLLAQRSRKRRPRRIDADALEFQQPPIDVKVHERGLSCDSLPENGDKLVLYGLAPFGVPYTTDFNISPLKVDTFFHESTFVGSGDFARSLKIALSRDLDLPAGITVHHIGDRMLRWSAWDENVSSELTSVFDFAGRSLDSVAEQLESNQGQRDGIPTVIEEVVSLLRFIIRYFTQTLSFIDPIDRSLFARKCIGLLKGFTDRLLARYLPMHQDVRSKLSYLHQDVMQIIAYNLVLANQIRQIASDDMVDASLSAEAEDLVKANASYMVSRLHRADFGTLRTFLEENRYHAKREAGIRGDSTTLEALIIMFHILRQSDLPNTSFWNLLYRQKLQVDSEKIHEVQILERTWHDIFTVLPLLEFDESGFIEVGRRFRSCADGWNAVRPLVSAALDSYLASPEKQPATFNSYCRALFDRCLHLINYWGWRKCEVIIGTLFDFFARSNLAHLRYEESRGSPNFLQNLDKCLTPESDPDDRCFHILLKVVGAGLKAMKDVYPEKKIRDIAWRLMPNHGRLHPKDMAVSQEDLDALRNHHDLLCVIYWASPPGFRPKLDVIRNLIDPGNSHREACHVNIRAWSNLIRFQLATDEPATSLEPFALWHEHFTKQMLSQHSLARGEAESQFASAASSGHVIISPELLESTIAKNQRQVEAVLSDALSSMKNALSVTRNVASAKVLLSKGKEFLVIFGPSPTDE